MRLNRKGPAVQAMLACGLVSTLLYAIIDIVGALSWPGYDPRSQAISELSAIGAPTAELLAPFQTLYNILLVLFGAGVWMTAAGRTKLRWCGGSIIALAALGIGWALFPMNLRGEERGLTDTMHLVMGALSMVLIVSAIATGAAGGEERGLTDTMHLVMGALSMIFIVSAIATGAAAFGRQFRYYSAATVLVMLFFGFLMGLDVPRVDADLATPWLGVNERLMMASWLLWMAVLSVKLLRHESIPLIGVDRSAN